jgi:ATP-binding cassette subfamily B multidrug efflux pump
MSFYTKLEWFFKQQWRQYTGAIILMTIVSILSIIPPKIIGNVIDRIRIGELTQSELTQTVLLLLGLALLLYILVYIWITTLYGNAILIEKLLRSRLLVHFTKMNPSFFQRNSTGELMALATNDVNAINMTAGYGVMTLVNTFVGASVVIITMATLISFKLMLAILLPLPFLALAISFLGKSIRHRFLDAQEAFGRMNDQALESISGMRVIRSYVQEEKDIEAFDKVTKDVMDKNIKVSFINAMFHPIISLIVGISFSIGIGYGSYLIFQNQITFGQLVSFNIYLGMLIWPMIAFGEFINVLQRGNASVDRLDNTFHQESDVQEASLIIPVEEPTSIEMKSLTFQYAEATVESLKNISFRLEKGQTLGIVGRTGSGKSTLLKQLLRQYPIQEKQLFISNVPIENIEMNTLKGWIGYVPQEHLLLSKSIKKNILLGNSEATAETLDNAIETSCLVTDIVQMPEGLETIVGENGVMLSGGQKQRIGIARALLVDPEVLILDDALSAVDAKTESRILHNIRSERRGKTTFIATHRLSAVNHADWILVLNDGEVVEEGTHEQLMHLEGWYKEQYIRQQVEASLLEEKGA